MFADLVKPPSSIRLADIARQEVQYVLSEGGRWAAHEDKLHATYGMGKKIISRSLYCSGVLAYYDSRSISPALPSSCSCQRPIIWSSKLEARKASLGLINDPLSEGPKHNLCESAVLKSVDRPWGANPLSFLPKRGGAVQRSAKVVTRLHECCRQARAEVISNSRNKIHQTWPKLSSQRLS